VPAARAASGVVCSSPAATPAFLSKRLLEMSAHLGQCLFHDNPEIVLETARVLGENAWVYFCPCWWYVSENK
jgi:hypothetical protein